jgi:hypothetical protein
LEGFPRTPSKSVRGTREGKKSGVETGAARDRGGPGMGTGQFGGRQPVARGELGVAESLRGRRPARLWQASGPHWALSANGRGRPSGPRGSGGDRGGWPGRARLPAEFRPIAKIKLKIPFLFPNLFIICKLI